MKKRVDEEEVLSKEHQAEVSILVKYIKKYVGQGVGKVITGGVIVAGIYVAGYFQKAYEVRGRFDAMDKKLDSALIINKKLERTDSIRRIQNSAVIDSIAKFRSEAKYSNMEFQEFTTDFIMFKVQYSQDIREMQKDIKDILKNQRQFSKQSEDPIDSLPKATFNKFYPITIN